MASHSTVKFKRNCNETIEGASLSDDGGYSFRISNMKLSLLPLSVSILLVSSMGVANAADQSAMSRHSSMSSTASMAKDNLSLTTAQQRLAWRDLSKQAASQPAPSNFSASL